MGKPNLQKILKQAMDLKETLSYECGSYENGQCQKLINTIKEEMAKENE